MKSYFENMINTATSFSIHDPNFITFSCKITCHSLTPYKTNTLCPINGVTHSFDLFDMNSCIVLKPMVGNAVILGYNRRNLSVCTLETSYGDFLN